MSENKSVENGSQPTPAKTGTASLEGCTASWLNKSRAISVCAAGIFICFFLLWARFFGHDVLAYALQKLGGNQKFLWLNPLSCVITIIAGHLKPRQKAAAQPADALLAWPLRIGFTSLVLTPSRTFLPLWHTLGLHSAWSSPSCLRD